MSPVPKMAQLKVIGSTARGEVRALHQLQDRNRLDRAAQRNRSSAVGEAIHDEIEKARIVTAVQFDVEVPLRFLGVHAHLVELVDVPYQTDRSGGLFELEVRLDRESGRANIDAPHVGPHDLE